MHQSRIEAHAEAEAAAEQRVAAALALERAELDKQARSWLCMCGDRHARSTALACVGALCVQSCVELLYIPCAWQHGTED